MLDMEQWQTGRRGSNRRKNEAAERSISNTCEKKPENADVEKIEMED
jgi:hypothetical protein